MKKHLFLLSLLSVSYLMMIAQDSTYYSVLWKPTEIYRKAQVTQEGIFIHYYKNGIVTDSVLYQVKFYDTLGRIIKYQYYQNNKLHTRAAYYYTANKVDSMQEEYFLMPAKTIHKYQYDAEGNIASEAVFGFDGKNTVNKRFTYNDLHQPLEIFSQTVTEKERLSTKYKYRSNHLIERIDYYFDKSCNCDDFSYVYTYADNGKTTTRLIEKSSYRQPITDIVRFYNDQNQLVKKTSPYISDITNTSQSFELHVNDSEEISIYLPDGMLSEVRFSKEGHLVRIEKHIYN